MIIEREREREREQGRVKKRKIRGGEEKRDRQINI